MGCIKLTLAQNHYRGSVAVEVVNFYTSEFDMEKFFIQMKMYISKLNVLLELWLSLYKPMKMF